MNNLILFLLLNYLQFIFINGMDRFTDSAALPPPPGPGDFTPPSTPSSIPNSSPTKPIDEIKFSLVELSFLIRILKQIDYNYLINASFDFAFHQNILMAADMILDKLGESDLKRDPLILSTLGKIMEISLFYHSMFDYLFVINGDDIESVNERIESYKHTMTESNYTQLLENFDLNLIENESIKQRLIDLKRYKQELFNLLYNFSKETTIVERNLFILWHFLAFTRKLIREFIIYHNNDNYYDYIIEQRCENDNIQNNTNNPILMVSIFQYMEVHDLFEIKANQIRQNILIKIEHIFQNTNIEFEHENVDYVRSNLLPTLQNAEINSEGILYKSKFQPIKVYEYYEDGDNEDIGDYFNVLFTLQLDIDHNMSSNILNTIIKRINENKQLYVFYYKFYKLMQRKLENILKPILLNIVSNFPPIYLPEDVVDLVKIKELYVPPQNYPQVLYQLAEYYGLTSRLTQNQPESSSGGRGRGRGQGRRGGSRG